VVACIFNAGDINLWSARELHKRMQGDSSGHAAGIDQQQSWVCAHWLINVSVCFYGDGDGPVW